MSSSEVVRFLVDVGVTIILLDDVLITFPSEIGVVSEVFSALGLNEDVGALLLLERLFLDEVDMVVFILKVKANTN